jgi:hypothetical protein
MKPDIPALIILTQREHQRLNNQIKRLQTYALDVEDLQKYRNGWVNNLGFTDYLPLLIQAVDTLIDALEQGDYDEALYDEVVFQLGYYKMTCWSTIKFFFGSLSPYMDRWANVKPEYREAFKQRYEAHRTLTVDEQRDVVRSILATIPNRRDPYNLRHKPTEKQLLVELGVLPDETSKQNQVQSEPKDSGKVIDFLSYKNRKR